MNESIAIEAVIFDTDGVVTRTTPAHFAAWKRLFDEFLRARNGDGTFSPFTDDDYRRDVDGKPRYDGVASFLATRGIELPWGDPTDEPGDTSVCALGNRKDGYFLHFIREHGVEAFPTTVTFIRELQASGVATAVISASRNCGEVLRAAHVAELFDVHVDGLDADRLKLAGKPDPAIFLEAARLLGVEPDRAGVVEDATAGVEAARKGGFGMVIGLDRTAHPDALAAYAHLVVPDLADVEVIAGPRIVHRSSSATRIPELTSALRDGDVSRRLDGRAPAVFLDYDGTLTPIVARPELATLAPDTAAALEALAAKCVVGIISGRDLEDLRTMVPDLGMWLAGSHGFELFSPNGQREENEAGTRALPTLDAAERSLRDRVAGVPEAWVERKRFAIAVHYRQTPEEHIPDLAERVREVSADTEGLRMAGGKKIFELRPDVPWDKGRALRWIMEKSGATAADALATYVGDDETDEDAFVEVRERGLGIVVGVDDRPTAAHHRLDSPDEVRQFLEWLARRDQPGAGEAR